ncbi:MAG: HEAT repeat protein [Planctomycetota bacterium]|jgi:HEAT repeat protein
MHHSLNRSQHHSLLSWFAALALLASIANAHAIVGQGDSEKITRYGFSRVVDELGASSSVTSEALLHALLVGGPLALPELNDALESDAEKFLAEDQELHPNWRSTYQLALDTLPQWVDRYVEPSAEISRADQLSLEIALRVLESSKADNALDQAIALITPKDHQVTSGQQSQKLLERTIAFRLANNPSEASQLRETIKVTPTELLPTIVRAIGKAPSAEATKLLTHLLHAYPDLDLLILAELGRVFEVTREAFDITVEMRVGLHIVSPKVALRREACLLAGRLELLHMIPQLIELLTDKDGGVCANAYWSLKRVTGKKLKAEPDRWSNWYDAEESWWNDDAQAAFSQLSNARPFEVSQGIRALSGHRLYRHEIAAELLVLLDHEKPSIVAQSCAALGVLRSGSAVPELRGVLSHEVEKTRDAAWQALKLITGRDDLPPESSAWELPRLQ